jgi:hypothetical protein
MSSSKKLNEKEQEAFDAFKKEFIKWQHRLQCGEYDVVFAAKRLDGKWAEISIDYLDRVALVAVNRKDLLNKQIALSAKHEAIHVFLFSMVYMAEVYS